LNFVYIKMPNCLAIDRNRHGCRCNAINDTRFCKNHTYMCDYTDEMIANQTICSGCKKSYYLPDGIKTCSNCKERGKQSKITAKETVVLCASDKCKSKRSIENTYCMKHQLCVFVDETAALGKKLCKQYVRGCRAQLDAEYPKSTCEECLVIEREKDRARRGYAQKTTAHEPNMQICTTCCKTLDEEQFIGHNDVQTKTCASCRESNRLQDLKRDKEHRNEMARIAEQKLERKAVKQQWNENNYEKVAMKSMNYRQRQIEADVDQYLNKNAENAKQWRDNNPEKVAISNQNRLENIKIHYSNYIRSANDKNLVFGLSQDVFDEIIKAPCCYCGIIQERGFNGIDRMNSEVGYVADNCVSCCQMCNYMKSSLSVDAFLGRVEHILTHNGRINGRLFPEMFPDYTSASYTEYKNRASKKNLDFALSQDEYLRLITQDCYLCGKNSNSQHLNGIDRIDNNKGYVMDNVKPCCANCNYMKKNYILEDVFNKFIDIYSFNIVHKTEVESNSIVHETMTDNIEHVENSVNNDITEPSPNLIKTEQNRLKQQRYREKIISEQGIEVLRAKETEKKRNQRNRNMVANKNKKTDEEKREEARLKKQRQRAELKERYGDEEYKKMRATELAAYRKNKQED